MSTITFYKPHYHLLIPNILDDSAAANVIERVQDMYMALMESEECMERVACEIGGLAEDAGFSKKMTKWVQTKHI